MRINSHDAAMLRLTSHFNRDGYSSVVEMDGGELTHYTNDMACGLDHEGFIKYDELKQLVSLTQAGRDLLEEHLNDIKDSNRFSGQDRIYLRLCYERGAKHKMVPYHQLPDLKDTTNEIQFLIFLDAQNFIELEGIYPEISLRLTDKGVKASKFEVDISESEICLLWEIQQGLSEFSQVLEHYTLDMNSSWAFEDLRLNGLLKLSQETGQVALSDQGQEVLRDGLMLWLSKSRLDSFDIRCLQMFFRHTLIGLWKPWDKLPKKFKLRGPGFYAMEPWFHADQLVIMKLHFSGLIKFQGAYPKVEVRLKPKALRFLFRWFRMPTLVDKLKRESKLPQLKAQQPNASNKNHLPTRIEV